MANPIGVLTSRVILAIGAISLAASFPGGRSMYKPWPGRARMGSMDG
ncbi:MAG: hypothetical protein IH998_11945 [Proteobacteria bacterium]|nr:hypothetical protein [Pseudomonadota bacterium]